MHRCKWIPQSLSHRSSICCAGHAQVCVAEIQSAGRGRRGRTWLAPFGSGLCLSLAWSFEESPPTLSALSLAVGVAVTRALRRFGGDSVQLKWPNDLVWNARKLGGILIEMRGESSGPTRVVIGLGLNLRLPPTTRLDLAKQQATLVTDLHEILGEKTPGRNALLSAVIDELLITLQIFERQGFEPFAEEWRNYDGLRDANVRVLRANEVINGIARGSAPDGALLVEVDGQVQRFVSVTSVFAPLTHAAYRHRQYASEVGVAARRRRRRTTALSHAGCTAQNIHDQIIANCARPSAVFVSNVGGARIGQLLTDSIKAAGALRRTLFARAPLRQVCVAAMCNRKNSASIVG